MRLKIHCCFTVLLGALLILAGTLPATALTESEPQSAEQETGFYYTVQKGDTLWDLSQKFFDSPFTWPGLWKKNEQLSNPHWIYPGQRIRLHLRKDWYKMNHQPEIPETIQPHYYYSLIKRIGFIRHQPLIPAGHIFKVQSNKAMIAQRDTVYIAQNGDTPLPAGMQFHVYRTLAPLKGQNRKTLIGTQHYFVGVVEILKTEGGYALATVKRSYRNIKVNDLVIPFIDRSPQIALTAGVEGFSGTIIAAEEDNVIFGDNTVVFVDKGKKDGVERGQMYSIYYREQEKLNPADKKAVMLAPVDIGTILILHAEPDTATALIIRAEQNIQPGAALRTPE